MGSAIRQVKVFEDYSCDLLEIVSYIQGKAKAAGRGSIPCYLVGISMGGCITCRAVEILGLALLQPGDASADKAISRILENRDRFIFRGEYPVPKLEPQVDGVILLAPMLSLEKLKKRTSHKLMLPFAGIASRYLPGLKVGAVAPNEKFPYIDQQKKVGTGGDSHRLTSWPYRGRRRHGCVHRSSELLTP